MHLAKSVYCVLFGPLERSACCRLMGNVEIKCSSQNCGSSKYGSGIVSYDAEAHT